MTTKLILIRHGESTSNAAGVFTGQSDYPLSERGREQAQCTAEFLKNEPIDAFYASDLCRAYDTAAAAAALHGLPVTPDQGLREIYAGEWEEKPFDTLIRDYGAAYAVWKQDIGCAVCTGGESVADLFLRVRGTIDRIVKQHPGQTVCLGTHATPIRAMQCFWMGLPLSEMKQIPWVPNASVTTILYEADGSFHDLQVGMAEHLGALTTRLHRNA